MDNNGTGFFDGLTDDLSDNDKKVVEQKTRETALEAQRTNFKNSVSVDAYHNRGFIKEGELIARVLNKSELRDSIVHLIVDNTDAFSVRHAETNAGVIDVFGEAKNVGIYRLSSESISGMEDIEQLLLKAISNNSEKFGEKKVDIYVFAPFKDSEVCKIV